MHSEILNTDHALSSPVHVDDIFELDFKRLSYQQTEKCLQMLQQEADRLIERISSRLAA